MSDLDTERLALLEQRLAKTEELLAILQREYPRLLALHAAQAQTLAEHIGAETGQTISVLADQFSETTAAHLEQILQDLEKRFPGLAARLDDRTAEEIEKALPASSVPAATSPCGPAEPHRKDYSPAGIRRRVAWLERLGMEQQRALIRAGAMNKALLEVLSQELAKSGGTREFHWADIVRISRIYHARKLRELAADDPKGAKFWDDRTEEERSVVDPDAPEQRE